MALKQMLEGGYLGPSVLITSLKISLHFSSGHTDFTCTCYTEMNPAYSKDVLGVNASASKLLKKTYCT